MKRLWVILGALAVFCALSVGTAGAVAVKTEVSIPWLAPNSAVPNGAWQTTSATQPLATETPDTTGTFTLRDCSFLGAGNSMDGVASMDSVLIGYLVIYSDSTADGASTLTAVTASFDASGDGRDWAAAGTAAGILASDDPIVALPVIQRAGLDHQSLFATAPLLRIRFATATGYLLAARCKFIYWQDK